MTEKTSKMSDSLQSLTHLSQQRRELLSLKLRKLDEEPSQTPMAIQSDRKSNLKLPQFPNSETTRQIISHFLHIEQRPLLPKESSRNNCGFLVRC